MATAKELHNRNVGPHKGIASNKRHREMSGPPKTEESGGWGWFTREMLESPAWQSLSAPAMRVVFRVLVEHLAHGRQINGQLPVTFDNFVACGISRKAVSGAIAQAVKYGFLNAYRGHRITAGKCAANTFGITWEPHVDGSPPSNRWKAIKERRKKRSPSALKGTVSSALKGTHLVPKRELGGSEKSGKPPTSPSAQKGTPIDIIPGGGGERTASVAPPRRKRSSPDAAPTSPTTSSSSSPTTGPDQIGPAAIVALESARAARGRP